jgi:transcriptional regulator with XRE-family HTH domain
MRLKELRISRNLSQKDIAKYINKTTQSYSLYERGERDPDSATLIKLADFFDVSVDYLLGRTNIPKMLMIKENAPPYDLPQEALDRIEEFKELMKLKYQKKPTSK